MSGMVRMGTARNDEIDGGVGNDRLFGLAGNDEIDGGRGDDLLEGGAGADDLDGQAGNDSLFGGDGNDLLNGGAGDDVLAGGAGADIFEFYPGSGRDVITDFTNGQDRIEIDGFGRVAVEALIGAARQVGGDVVLDLGAGRAITLQDFRLADLDLSDFRGFGGGTGPVVPPVVPPMVPPAPGGTGRDIYGTGRADVLIGTAGNDDMDGRAGNDQMRGGAGNDDMDGGNGNDRLWGEDGRDDIDGGRGNDRLDGGAGDDILVGGRGNDTLTGGSGADLFEFRRGDGRDLITDFTDGVDRIELDGFSGRDLTAILNGARQVGDDVVLTLSARDSITLADVQLSQLDRSDFLL
ncbi:MAG: calcium-binding protein [Paracoccaceae bacterium]